MLGDIRGRLDRVEESVSSAVAAIKAMAVAVIIAMVVSVLAFVGVGRSANC